MTKETLTWSDWWRISTNKWVQGWIVKFPDYSLRLMPMDKAEVFYNDGKTIDECVNYLLDNFIH